MSGDSVSQNSNKNNKINNVNIKNFTHYLKLYNNTVILLNLLGYHLVDYLSGDILLDFQ